jgi:hypothetical protein
MQDETIPTDAPAADVFPDFAISLEEAGKRIKELREYMRSHMTDGEDYGIIPGTNKPTLFKPGAEKLNLIYGLAPLLEVTNRVEDWDTGFIAYEVKVTLINKRSKDVEAEGVGSCNSRERRYKNQDAPNIANTLLKMAKKRALIDATLSATRASGIFTQDLEDMDRDDVQPQAARSAPRQQTQHREYSPVESAQSLPRQNGHQGHQNGNGAQQGTAGGDTCTEAQRGAILAIGNKVFGRNSREEMAKMMDKPITKFTKAEASAFIDRLRAMLPEQ